MGKERGFVVLTTEWFTKGVRSFPSQILTRGTSIAGQNDRVLMLSQHIPLAQNLRKRNQWVRAREMSKILDLIHTQSLLHSRFRLNPKEQTLTHHGLLTVNSESR